MRRGALPGPGYVGARMESRFGGFDRTDVGAVPVLWRRDTRFKTFRLSLLARRPLDGRAAARGLLSTLLLQGTRRDQTRLALVRRMEMLYASSAAPGTMKLGETHTLRVALDCVAGTCLPGRPDQLGEGLTLLAEILTEPRLVAGAFPLDVFERERKNQANAVRAEFDDKGTYAYLRALEHACAGEPMAIPEHGGLEAIAALDGRAPEAARDDFLRHGELLVLGMGALPADFEAKVARFLARLPPRAPEPIGPPVRIAPRPRRAVVEASEVRQSKLLLVFRFPPAAMAAWPARRLFANMLGGGAHARLFKEVREKRSLAYYAQAAVDPWKGLMVVSVGLDATAAEAVEAETLRQIGLLQRGEFTDAELAVAKAGVTSALAAVEDSIASRLSFLAERFLEGVDRTPEQQAEVFATLSPAEVAAGGAGLWLDCVYLLGGPAGSPAVSPAVSPAGTGGGR